MSKCPLCGSKLQRNLIDLRIAGNSLPEIYCENCDYDIVAYSIESKEMRSLQAQNAFDLLESLNQKLLEKTELHDTIKNLADR